jgi:glycosyltransferase involved in cell wall biosynthesis
VKIAFVTLHELNTGADPHTTGFKQNAVSMFRALQTQGLDLVPIESLRTKQPMMARMRRVLSRYSGTRHALQLEPAVLRHYGEQVSDAARAAGCDLIFSQSSRAVAYLPGRLPTVIWRDATFAGALASHRGLRNMAPRSVRLGHAMERRALQRVRYALFRSDWAARDAIASYGADPARVRVVPTGGNLNVDLSEADVLASFMDRPRDRCRLLFIGVDWEAKGGDTALAVARELNDRGLPTELIVAGCAPQCDPLPSFVKALGFIDGNTPSGRERIVGLMRSSHLLIMPSRRETYGNVFAEASSVGLPCIGSRAGGIPTVVREGINGATFAEGQPLKEYADYIIALMGEPERYHRLALSANRFYRERLHWNVAGAEVRELLEQIAHEAHEGSTMALAGMGA